MKKSYELLNHHPINLERAKQGKRKANSLWFWGEGVKPKLDSFYQKFGLRGSVVSAVDLLKGIAICAGMNSVDVKGATGYIDTNFEGKLEAAISEFKNGKDFVYIHIEAPDECGHRGEYENKVKAIELIDQKIVIPLVKALQKMGDYAILICPDHPTPLEIRTHSRESVPYLIYKSNEEKKTDIEIFDEESAAATGIYVDKGYELILRLIK